MDTFKNSCIWFNHFIKVDDFNMINVAFLWTLVARGAAVLCSNNQRAVDILVPIVYHDGTVGRKNISAIFIQIKNDIIYSSVRPYLFDEMNPLTIKVFGHLDKPLPIIRMVFALGSWRNFVTIMEPARSTLHQLMPHVREV